MRKIQFICLLIGLCACGGKAALQSPSQTPAPLAVQTQTAPAETVSTTSAPMPQKEQTPAAPALVQKTPTPAAASPSSTEIQTQPVAAQKALELPVVFTPAPDKPVFKDEELIDLNSRRLHPYTAFTPDTQTVQTAPWAYEQLKYGIYYTFIKAGTAYIRNRGLVDINGRPAYLLQTTAFSASVIDTVFKVRDINHSWLDAQNLYSLGYGQSVREGNYIRDEWAAFDYAAGKYTGSIQKKSEPRPISGPLEIPVLDMLTSLYYVRAQELQVGKDIVFDIINREKQYPLVVKVLKKEKIKTDAGTFKCIVVEPQIRGEGIFVSKGKSLKVWLTDDQYKMPVKMKVEVFIGSVSAQLLEYTRQAPANVL